MTSQARFPYQDSTLDVKQRVEDLLSRMDLEDKVGLMFHPIATVGALDEVQSLRSWPARYSTFSAGGSRT